MAAQGRDGGTRPSEQNQLTSLDPVLFWPESNLLLHLSRLDCFSCTQARPLLWHWLMWRLCIKGQEVVFLARPLALFLGMYCQRSSYDTWWLRCNALSKTNQDIALQSNAINVCVSCLRSVILILQQQYIDTGNIVLALLLFLMVNFNETIHKAWQVCSWNIPRPRSIKRKLVGKGNKDTDCMHVCTLSRPMGRDVRWNCLINNERSYE